MVSAPVKSAPVNDPKNCGVPGAKVRMIAPVKSGTIIIPPGIRSIVRLMGSWTMARPRGDEQRCSSSVDPAPRRRTRQVAPLRAASRARRLEHADPERDEQDGDGERHAAVPARARVGIAGGADAARSAQVIKEDVERIRATATSCEPAVQRAEGSCVDAEEAATQDGQAGGDDAQRWNERERYRRR